MAAGRAHTRLGQERERLARLQAMLDAELQAEAAGAGPVPEGGAEPEAMPS